MADQHGLSEHKQCSQCGKVQDTANMRCKFCGARYPEPFKPESTTRLHTPPSDPSSSLVSPMAIVAAIICVVSAYFLWNKGQEPQRHEAARKHEEEMAGKPQVIDEYVAGCRDCERYTPIFDAVKAKYRNRIYFERKDVGLVIGTHPYPLTWFFDKNGNTVNCIGGVLSKARLTQLVSQFAQQNGI